MVKVFSDEYWRDINVGLADKLPICVTPQSDPDDHRLLAKYLDVQGGSIYEVGCSPGRYLAYFARYWNMRVAGIEYTPVGARLTRRNLDMQGLSGDIFCGDFFESDLPDALYDVVFSGGFIEHWPDTAAVVTRIASIAKQQTGWVVTIIPNYVGFYGWLRKYFARPEYEGHVPITREALRRFHENAGLETFFCDYNRAPRLDLPPSYTRKLAKKHPHLVKTALFGQRALNSIVKRMCRFLKRCPRSAKLSPSVIYIGRRRASGPGKTRC